MSKEAGFVVVTKGELIPFNGKVTDGQALVDESVCCGVSTPVWIDSSQRNEVWADGLIVEGWLRIEKADAELPKAVTDAQPGPDQSSPLSTPPLPEAEDAPSSLSFSLVGTIAAAIIAFGLGCLCGYALTHSRAATLGAGTFAALAVLFETLRHRR